MSSSTIANNAARFPLEVARGFVKSPGLVNDIGAAEMAEVARILLRAGQRHFLEQLVLMDGITAQAKGFIARALNENKQRLH